MACRTGRKWTDRPKEKQEDFARFATAAEFFFSPLFVCGPVSGAGIRFRSPGAAACRRQVRVAGKAEPWLLRLFLPFAGRGNMLQ